MAAQIPVGQLAAGQQAGKPQRRGLARGEVLAHPSAHPDLTWAEWMPGSQWEMPGGEQLGMVPCGVEQGNPAPQLQWVSWGLPGDIWDSDTLFSSPLPLCYPR